MEDLPVSGGLSRPWLHALAIGAGLAAAFFWQPLSRLLWQIGFSILLSMAALPLCRQLEKKLPRAWAAGLSVGALALLAAGFIALFIPPLIAQISLLVAELPRLLSRFQSLWEGLSQQGRMQEWIEGLGGDVGKAEQWLGKAFGWLGDRLPGLISGLGAGIDAVSRAFLAPILTFYFLRDREIFTYRLSLWIPLRHRKRMLTALQEMRREAGGYVRGQLLVGLSVAILTAAGLLIIGIPAWLALGILMGLCELIPYVGPLIGGIPIAIFSLPMGWKAVLWALGVVIAIQQIEGNFLSPRLMAGATGLHPVSILLLLSAGGLLFGLAGMVLALPFFVCLRGAARVLYGTRAPGPPSKYDGK